jgi:TBC1 domain family member 20
MRTLRQFPALCYFQGYHDIVQVLMLVLGDECSREIVSRVSLLRIRDFMLPDFEPSLDQLQLLPAILFAEDPDLAKHLSLIRPDFALASTLTMFAHEIPDYGMIARLFDFLLAHEASLSIYLFAAIILSRRDELFILEEDDVAMLHHTLKNLPESLDFDALISGALELFRKHPPQQLPFRAWKRISSYSVLKTTRASAGSASGLPALQTLKEGDALFKKQVNELKRRDLQKRVIRTLRKNQRPIAGIGLAIFVGAISIWLQRNGQLGGLWWIQSKFWNLLELVV